MPHKKWQHRKIWEQSSKLNFGIQDVTINGDDEFTMSLEQGTIEELQTLLNTLN